MPPKLPAFQLKPKAAPPAVPVKRPAPVQRDDVFEDDDDDIFQQDDDDSRDESIDSNNTVSINSPSLPDTTSNFSSSDLPFGANRPAFAINLRSQSKQDSDVPLDSARPDAISLHSPPPTTPNDPLDQPVGGNPAQPEKDAAWLASVEEERQAARKAEKERKNDFYRKKAAQTNAQENDLTFVAHNLKDQHDFLREKFGFPPDWPVDAYTLFVGSLSPETTKSMLDDVFSSYPSFLCARVVRDDKNKCRGFGHVCFQNAEDVLRAYKEKNRSMIDGRQIMIERALLQDYKLNRTQELHQEQRKWKKQRK